jgi:hypothetical protein
VPLALAAPKGLKRAAAAASADDVLPIMAVGTGCAALVMCPGSEAARVLKRVRTIVMQLPVAADGTMPMALTTAAQYYLGMCQSYDATDRRTSNPGGKATGVSNFSAGAKAMWIYAVEWQEQNHSPNPVSAALCNHSTPILPTRYFRGKEVVNIEYHQMMSNISRWCDPDHRDVILSNAADSKRKCLLNSASGRDPSFPKMEKVLAAEIIKAREAKHRVALDWLSVRAVALLKQQPELRSQIWSRTDDGAMIGATGCVLGSLFTFTCAAEGEGELFPPRASSGPPTESLLLAAAAADAATRLAAAAADAATTPNGRAATSPPPESAPTSGRGRTPSVALPSPSPSPGFARGAGEARSASYSPPATTPVVKCRGAGQGQRERGAEGEGETAQPKAQTRGGAP